MLEAKNITKKFGENLVLKGINIQIEKGEKLAIIGPSGCGKSTFLRCLNLLEAPTSGKILYEGKELSSSFKNLSLARRKIGMVFQQFNLFPHLTVLENLILAPVKLNIMGNQEAKDKALSLLKEIGLLEKQNHFPDELSGGQKQRVAITRTLMMDPDILLFDEPTSALDPEMVGEVLELIQKLAEDGRTMVIVSHEMNFVHQVATRLAFMEDGKISFLGTPEEAFQNTDNARLQEFLSKIK